MSEEISLCGGDVFEAQVSDSDRWHRDCPSSLDGYPYDSLTYNWQQIAGSNPQLGTYKTPTNEQFVYWQAPPCIGTIIIKLTADDKPDEAFKACPGGSSDRNDPSKDFEKTVNVVLPTGCEEAGAHDSSIHWIHPDDNFESTTCSPFGYCAQYSASKDVNFAYENCQWKCEISNVVAETTIEVRCPTCIPGMVSVFSASEVPCAEANLAKYDLDDTDLSDDIGAPRNKYWCYEATVAHELFHRSEWMGFYGSQLNAAISACEAMTVTIDCGDSYTTTCLGAYYLKIGEINQKFSDAFQNAVWQMNDPNTPLNEAEQRAYTVSYVIEHSISAALPAGCGP